MEKKLTFNQEFLKSCEITPCIKTVILNRSVAPVKKIIQYWDIKGELLFTKHITKEE